MKFNVFEGARRLGYFILALFAIAPIYVLFSGEKTLWHVMSAAMFPLGFYFFMLVTGWIVRGFFGIPMGKDFKE